MNNEEMFEFLADIEEAYVAEAKRNNSAKSSIWRYLSVAAALVLVIGGIAVAQLLFHGGNAGLSMKAIAAEIGKEYIQFGATMPHFVSVNGDQVIMYDYVGIWVYDLKQEELVGFCDFRPIDMTQVQGYPCVFVEATADGKYVKFYLSDGSVHYLYDVGKNSYEKVDRYDENLLISYPKRAENIQLSSFAETYEMTDGGYISYVLDPGEGQEQLCYGDLIIVVEKNGVRKEYRPFEE